MIRSLNNDRRAFSPPSLQEGEAPRAATNRSKVAPEVVKAAEGMEAMFVDFMMKVMRETVPKNEMDLESPATGIYRGMLDSEYAQSAVRHGGIGLADQIIDYLAARDYHMPQGHGVPVKEKP